MPIAGHRQKQTFRTSQDPEGNPAVRDDLFEKAVAGVLQELPEDLKGALASVQIVIQTKPSSDQIKQSNLKPEDDLFGLFEGFSLREMPVGADRTFPDRIVLFEESLREHYPRKEDLSREIRRTLIHEIGHFFGFNEKELKDRGWD